MGTGMIIFLVVMSLIAYCLIGSLAWCCFILNDWEWITKDPLWRPFAKIFWPISLIIVIIFNIVYYFNDWIDDVKDYRRKNKKE